MLQSCLLPAGTLTNTYTSDYPCVHVPASRKRQRGAIGLVEPKKRKVAPKQLLTTPVQLSSLLETPNMRASTLVVPEDESQYVSARSSKKYTVWLPLWIEIDGNRFEQLPCFPGLISGERYSAGAQGCVAAYECVDESLGLPLVAVKTVPMFTSRRKNRTTYTKRKSTWSCEWKMHDYLQSQDFGEINPVVEVYGGLCSEIHGMHQIFFAMEHMDKDMFTVIEENRGDGKWLLQALVNTAKSLNALHKAGIIYCDLKPENVLIRNDGTAKFGDFDRSCVPKMKIGLVGGTRGYESPERVVDSTKKSVEDDTWAFGVTILIVGTMASSPYAEFSLEDFSNFTPSLFLQTQCRKNFTPVQLCRLGALCDQLLKVDPLKRASMEYAIQELTNILTVVDTPQRQNSAVLLREASAESINLGLPLIDLTREAPLSNSTVICSASTSSSERCMNVLIPEV